MDNDKFDSSTLNVANKSEWPTINPPTHFLYFFQCWKLFGPYNRKAPFLSILKLILSLSKRHYPRPHLESRYCSTFRVIGDFYQNFTTDFR